MTSGNHIMIFSLQNKTLDPILIHIGPKNLLIKYVEINLHGRNIRITDSFYKYLFVLFIYHMDDYITSNSSPAYYIDCYLKCSWSTSTKRVS